MKIDKNKWKKCIHFRYGLGLQKIVKNKSLLTEDELKNIDGDPNELSLFSCIVVANIYWKPNSKMMCIKNMHFGVNNGNTEQVEKIKPFMSYFTVCQLCTLASLNRVIYSTK